MSSSMTAMVNFPQCGDNVKLQCLWNPGSIVTTKPKQLCEGKLKKSVRRINDGFTLYTNVQFYFLHLAPKLLASAS